MRKTLIFIVLVFICGASGSVRASASDETEKVIMRFNEPKHLNLLQGAMWTVTHDYSDIKNLDRVLKSVSSYFEAFAKYQSGDKQVLEKLGSIGGFKKLLGDLIKDNDQAIRALGAVLIGISGDVEMAPNLVAILDRREEAKGERIIYDRGRAALALGLLGAAQYKPKLAALLKSKNEYDRSGAISGLGELKATEFSTEIAAMLVGESNNFRDDASPVYFLVETGTAKRHEKELVKALSGRFTTESSKAAMYALVSINSTESATEISNLLNDRFLKADAAKALALLGANKYSHDIALLLNDESALVRSAALLAVGILKATKYQNDVAKALSSNEKFVQISAAQSIFLMEAESHYAAAILLLEKRQVADPVLTVSDFSPFVNDKIDLLDSALKKRVDDFINARKKLK